MPPRPPPLGPDILKGIRWGFGAAAFWVGLVGDLSRFTIGRPAQMAGPNEGARARPHDWSGWTLICGPSPSPTPSVHGQTMEWKFYGPGGGCATPQCTLAGQSVSLPFENAASIVAPGADCARLWQGPAPALLPLRRYYLVEQRSRPGGGAVPGVLAVPNVVPYPGTMVAVGQPVTRPGLISVGVAPVPVRWAPLAPLPVWPEQSDRGYRAPARGFPAIGIAVTAPTRPIDAETGKPMRPPIVKPYPVLVDVKTAPGDVERKMADPSGRMAAMFRSLSVWGSANGVIDALWRSLPSHAKSAHARTAQKYADVFSAFARGDINADAFTNAVGYWLGYKAAGQLYGTAFRATQGLGQGGYQLYRAWATGEYVGSSAGVLFRGTAVERAVSSPSRTTVSYRGARTIERGYQRALSRIERSFRAGFAGETRGSRINASKQRSRRIRELNRNRQRALVRQGHSDPVARRPRRNRAHVWWARRRTGRYGN